MSSTLYGRRIRDGLCDTGYVEARRSVDRERAGSYGSHVGMSVVVGTAPVFVGQRHVMRVLALDLSARRAGPARQEQALENVAKLFAHAAVNEEVDGVGEQDERVED